jgi:tRNA A-37 threonylcarbamoyl transferase component Bud32
MNDNDDGEPPDISNESTLTVTFHDTKNFKSLENVLEGSLGKHHHALIRVVSTFNNQCYTKPVKYDNSTWFLPKRRFNFSSNDPEGEIRVSLLENHLPPLPAVPCPAATNEPNVRLSNGGGCHKKKPILAKLTIPISFMELKQSRHLDRWYTLDFTTPENHPTELPQVRISLDFNYKPSRVVDSVDSLNMKYDIEDTLGTGVSVVKKAVQKHTKKEYAVKYLQKKIKGQNIPRPALENEIELLKTISHPAIVQLYETLEDANTIYLIMELIKGSDLFDISDFLGTLRPASVAALLTPLLSALCYMHSRGIVHHDIKPENIIVDYNLNTLKLTDFGSAKFCSKNIEGAVGGTLNYMAPEVLLNMRGARNVCDKSVDIWSIGILTYLLISGNHPFDSKKSNENILNRIIKGKFKMEGPIWEKVPKDCKDFIKKCLVIDPKKRATAEQLLKHPWIVGQSKAVSFFLERRS